GVTRPVVYGAYDGLGPLLLALLDRQQARLLGSLVDALPDDWAGDPQRELEASVRTLVQTVVADPEAWRPVLFADDATPIQVRERIAADRELIRKQVAVLIADLLRGADPEVL